MRSLQWMPYVLTEESVSSQAELLSILRGVRPLQNQTRRAVPMLVDMDIHYRIMKLIYGSQMQTYDFGLFMSLTPVLYGVCCGSFLLCFFTCFFDF
jgi:hypothetical protein